MTFTDARGRLSEHWGFYVWGAVIAIVLILTYKTAYNLYFHPLRNFPGPLIHRASPIPYMWQSLLGRAPMSVHNLHERYGPVVRLTPNHLSFTDIRAWRDIYGHRIPPNHEKTDHKIHPQEIPDENHKSPIHYGILPDIPPSILDAPRDEHSLIRKALSHGFSERALRSQESRIKRYVDFLVLRLDQHAHEGKMDIAKWYNWVAFDIVGDLVFAESFGCLEQQEYHPFVELIVGTIRGGNLLMVLNYLGLGVIFRVAWTMGVQKLLTSLRAQLAEKIGKRIETRNVDVEDLFEGLMRHRIEWGIEMDRLTSNASILVAAGSETTATLLGGVTYLLVSNPQVMANLKREVRSAFKSTDEITITSASSRLPYMLACLNEALRMYPPVTSGLVRMIANGGAVVARNVIPGGTLVECQQWAMNHSSSHWEKPWTFQPERFLHHKEGEDAGIKRDTLEAMQPFSVGPRNCIGRNLAYAEMRLILANLIYSFDLSLADESKGWIENQKAFSLWARGPLYISVEPVSSK